MVILGESGIMDRQMDSVSLEVPGGNDVEGTEDLALY